MQYIYLNSTYLFCYIICCDVRNLDFAQVFLRKLDLRKFAAPICPRPRLGSMHELFVYRVC